MRELFRENLPVGPDTEKIEQYFNELEEVISTTEDVNYESFPDTPERDYRYFSTALLEQQARRHHPQPLREDVDPPALEYKREDTVQSLPGEDYSVQHVS